MQAKHAGVREVWLIDPIDRTLTIYQLGTERYERATILELKGQTKAHCRSGRHQ